VTSPAVALSTRGGSARCGLDCFEHAPPDRHDCFTRGFRVFGRGDQHSEGVRRGEQNAGQGFERLLFDDSVAHKMLQAGDRWLEAVKIVDGRPLGDSEGGRSIDHEKPDCGGLGHVEERHPAGHEELPGVALRERRFKNPFSDLFLDLDENGSKQVSLVLEVVIERATGHTGGPNDVRGGRAVVGALLEELPG
jgi:hypothetical protein